MLRFDLAQVAARSQMDRGWDAQYRLKEQLVPVCGVFALLGIAVGMGGRFLIPLAPRAGYRPYWAFVILAGVAAVLVVSLPYWASLFSATILECLAVENLAWTTLLFALICFAIELIIRAKSPAALPFDQLASSPQAAGRFIWLVVGFIVLCVAAMPTLLVAGQAVLHAHTHAADLAKYGWPR